MSASEPPSASRAVTSRRAALGLVAGAGLIATAGCQLNTSHLDGPAPEDVDLPAAVEALRLTRQLVATIQATLTRHHDLRLALIPALALHRAHLAELTRAVPSGKRPAAVAAPPVKARSAAALVVVHADQAALQQRLAGLAQRVHSGDFARLLAAMAAGIGQRLAAEKAGAA